MAQQFNLPDIGSGLQEAEIVTWLVKVGEEVGSDQVLCEVETEKSVVEIPVPFDGVVLEIAGPEGTSVQVGEMLVVIGAAGEEVTASPVPSSVSAEVAPVAQPPASPTAAPTHRPPAMPLIRRLARERGVDLAALVGSGVGGRITRADVEAAAIVPPEGGKYRRPGGAGVGGSTAGTPDRTTTRQPLSKLRRTIAAHMTEQWQSVPHITAHVDGDAGRLIAARKAIGARLDRKVPIDALLAAAVISALRQFPSANAAIEGDDLVVRNFYDIGIAVGSPDGLLVPVVRNVDRLALPELIDRVADLTARAKERKLAPEEMGGQTFTISNLGALRGRHATQVIPAGTTAIMSFGRANEEAVVRNGQIVVAPMMAVSGTFDHRALDGVDAMGVVNAVVDVLEEPTLLLV
ncbi:MAG: dihydrolipoamide acetyltransferase family protein [Acidimicrobiia bacterium]